MSKNVAVFVDVANIFYAAKAAGVDIDYVTLLKAATAGRDFVRAYAYTGLDPENENQRQFHSFLARSGYKVVSKDIRKYGDGRIKANLDIELVVDLMRTARNLDIAVVVSGDGDFAPAIRAVQQMGVRVEVVSFRGNTSSDLIEVADVFTDISQIARVDKAGARSGRRVAAAEGDLSMTAVPDKETEGAVRRRRGRGRGADRDETPAAVAVAEGAETSTMPGNLIVLPGEKLARVRPDEEGAEPELAEVAEADERDEDAPGAETQAGDGRRRRRRRGGRGRGRSRVEEMPAAAADPEMEVEDDDAGVDIAPMPLPQHSTFGSVWDSQLGVPAAPLVTTGSVADDEDLEDEPEIPEYLLAERRQRGQRGRQGGPRMGQRDRGGRAASGYQAAIERERYGRTGSPTGGSPFGMPRREDRGRQDQARGGRRQRGGRPERPHREERAPGRPVSSDPWTEVPPEIEELLRAELSRRGGLPAGNGTGAGTEGTGERPSVVPVSAQPDPELDASIALPTEAELTGTVQGTESTPAAPSAAVAGEAAGAAPEELRPRRRTTRRPATRGEAAAAAAPEAVAAGAPDASSEPARPPAAVAHDAGAAGEAAADAGQRPRRRTARRQTPPESAGPDVAAAEQQTGSPATGPSEVGAAEAAEPAPRRRATRRRTTADAATDGETPSTPAADAPAPDGSGEGEKRTRRRATRTTKATETGG